MTDALNATEVTTQLEVTKTELLNEVCVCVCHQRFYTQWLQGLGGLFSNICTSQVCVYVSTWWVAGRGLILHQSCAQRPVLPLSPHELSIGPSMVIKLLRQALLQRWSFSLLAMLLPHFLVNSNCMENGAVSMLNGSGIAGWIKGHKGMAADTAQAGLRHGELMKAHI